MPIDVKFSADLTEVRKALDQVASEAKARAVTVPVGAAVGNMPTPGGVFGASAAVMAPMASPGFAGFGGGTAPVAGAVLGGGGGGATGFFGGTGGRGSGANLSGGGMLYGFGSRGLITSLATGMLASGIGRTLAAGREYGMAQILAGSDQGAQLEAQLQAREQYAMAFPFVGRARLWAEDPTGIQEAGIRATILSADATNVATEAMVDNANFVRGLAGQNAILMGRNQFEQQRAARSAGFDRDIAGLDARRNRELNRRRRAMEIGATAAITDEMIERRQMEIMGRMGGAADPGADAVREQLRQEYIKSGMDAATAQFNRKIYDPARAALQTGFDLESTQANYLERMRLRSMRSGITAESDALRMEAAGDPRGAAVRRLRSAGEAEILDAYSRGESVMDVVRVGMGVQNRLAAQRDAFQRVDRYRNEDLDRQAGIADALMRGDTEEAKILEIQAERDKELRENRYADPNRVRTVSYAREQLVRRDLRRQRAETIGALAYAEEELAIDRGTFVDRNFRMQAAEGEGRVLAAALATRGPYSGLAGRSRAITEEAMLERARLRQEGAPQALINQVGTNAQMQQSLLIRDFLEGFRSTVANPRDISPFISGGNSNVENLLRQIVQNTRDIFAAR